MFEIFRIRNLLLFISLFLFWMLLSSRLSLEGIIAGLVVAACIAYYNKELSLTERETLKFHPGRVLFFIKFIFRLVIEIFKANIEVSKILLSPSMPISPQFVKVPAAFQKDMSKVIYSNAVTLTPGTLTVDVLEDGFIIHALTASAADGIKDCIIEKSVKELEDI